MEIKDYITGIQHLGIPSANPCKAAVWYEEKLGFTKIHEKTALKSAGGGSIAASFVKQGNLLIELFRAEYGMPATEQGVFDHYAIEAPDLEDCVQLARNHNLSLDSSTPDGIVYYEHLGEKGVKGINFSGPEKEVIEFCQDCARNYGGLKGLNGWSHLAVKVANLEQSVCFYEILGFRKISEGYVDTPDGRLYIAFVDMKGFCLELIQVQPQEWERIKRVKTGKIDHVAFDVTDAREAFYACKKQGLAMLDCVVKELDFFEHGIRYFMIEGPNGEHIEFNQKKRI